MENSTLKFNAFDEHDVKSISEFGSKICDMRKEDMNESMAKYNLEKAIKSLRKLDRNEQNTEKTIELLKLTQNMTFNIQSFCYSEEIVEWIVSLNIHNLVKDIINII